jgi:polysaccharide export outer membrane protein
MVYFNGGIDSASIENYNIPEPLIQKGDLLLINISSRSGSSNQLFSLNFGPDPSKEISTTSPSASSPSNSGYLVELASGDIHLPLFGKIHADGMTKKELEYEIVKRAREYVNEDPNVDIRFKNFRVTFLGIVENPGTINFESERVSFFQALGEAKGIAQGGDIKNIQLFREINGKRTREIIDLSKGDIFSSSNYYLRQNDVIYVPPTDRQLIAMDQSAQRKLQFVSLGFSLANIILILINILR